jgi:single-stranded DNA-binding protein
MEFQQDNSYVFYSALRGEMVYLFGPLVASSWTRNNCVEIVYVDGRNEQVLLPFSNHMMIDDGGGMEEEKENEEEEQQEEEQVEVPHPVTPQPQPNNDDEDNTDNEFNDEEPNEEYNVIEP